MSGQGRVIQQPNPLQKDAYGIFGNNSLNASRVTASFADPQAAFAY